MASRPRCTWLAVARGTARRPSRGAGRPSTLRGYADAQRLRPRHKRQAWALIPRSIHRGRAGSQHARRRNVLAPPWRCDGVALRSVRPPRPLPIVSATRVLVQPPDDCPIWSCTHPHPIHRRSITNLLGSSPEMGQVPRTRAATPSPLPPPRLLPHRTRPTRSHPPRRARPTRCCTRR